MPDKLSVSVKNLIKRYKKETINAVDDISFDVKEGEFFALLGPNGAGKTTTISILTTTLSKTSGQVIVAGHDLDTQIKEVRKNIGIIFQNPSLDLHLTAEQNIRFHVSLYGLYPYNFFYKFMPLDYRKKIEELAAIFGLQGSMFKKLATFSGGMKRKLEIMRSLMHQPKIMFLDEPTAGLDPVSRRDLWRYLQTMRKETNMTIFLTTHYLDEAEGADRVCIITKGKIKMIDTPFNIKQGLTGLTLVLDATDREALRTELNLLKIGFIEQGDFVIKLNDTKDVQKIISGIKTPLSAVHINELSLEKAYIDLIGKDLEKEVQL